jgi:DNA repair exonuclease SbcCD ATPase subunit
MLSLAKITLENFKKHEFLEIDFRKGLNVIVGKNYAGKSTVIHSVLFAFFGVSAVPGGSKTIPRRGTKNSTTVTLEADTGKGRLVIERSLSGCSVTLASTLEAVGTTPCNGFIEELLGADKATILALGYAEQSETASLLTLGAAKTNSLIEQVAKVSYVDFLIGKASELAAQYKKSPEEYELLQKELSAAEAELSTATKKKETLEAGLVLASEAVDRADTRTRDASSKYGAAKAQIEAYLSSSKKKQVAEILVVQKKADLEEKEEALLASLLEHGSVDKLKENILKAEVDLGTLRSELSKHQDAVLKNKLADYDVKASKESLEDFERQKTEYSKFLMPEAKILAHSQLLDQISETKSIHLILKDQHDKAKFAVSNGVCGSCKRAYEDFNVEEHTKLAEELSRKCEEASTKVLALTKESLGLKKEIDLEVSKCEPKSFSAALADAQQRHRAAVEVQVSLQDLATEGPEFLALLESKIEDLRNDLEKIRRNKMSLAALEQAANSARVNLSVATNSLVSETAALEANPEISQEEVSLLEAEALKAREAHAGLRLAEASIKTSVEYEEKIVALSEKSKKRALEGVKLHESMQAMFKKYTAFVAWLRKNKADFMQNIWNGILTSVSQFASTSTSGVISEVMRSSDGEFFFMEQGESEPLPVSGCASGGQKAIMGTGLKLALSQYLPQGFGFMLLDEPSSELNQEHTVMLSAALKGTGQQIVMVSHREADEAMCDHLTEI